MRDLARLAVTLIILVAVISSGRGLAQKAAAEMHVQDIRDTQPQEMIEASALCRKVRANDEWTHHKREVNPATLQTDLSALLQKSDEVVLVGSFIDQTLVLSPSGEDAITFHDVKVLRTWKGTHKPGDLLTFAIPEGAVNCGLEPGHDIPAIGVVTSTGAPDWEGIRSRGPYVLFLRQSQGSESQLIPGLRLAGGDGLQGLFALHSRYEPRSAFEEDCRGIFPGSVARCDAKVDASDETVKLVYRRDPLKKKYEGMPVPSFLKEVKSVADSLSYSGPVTVSNH